MTERYTTEKIDIQKPIFDGGTFVINFLSTSSTGFQVQTEESLPRHLPNTPLPEARRIREQRDHEPLRFRIGPRFAPKVGLRNIRQIGDNLLIDIKPVTFPTVKAINSLEESKEALDMANSGAVAGILLTTENDGSHNFIVQHRSASNFFYGDIPGASVAGYLDGELDSQNRGRLKPVDTSYIKDNLATELEEELGIGVDEIEDIRIIGLASEKRLVHDEFLLFGITSLSTEQIAETVEKRAKEKKPDDEFDFEGSYFVIPGTPEAILTLLTEVKCPLPPTHTAAFVATGYNLILESEGLENALEWIKRVELGIKINNIAIDEIVREYWKNNQDKISIRPTDKPERKIYRYDPAFTAPNQGLPDITTEMKRVGLIS